MAKTDGRIGCEEPMGHQTGSLEFKHYGRTELEQANWKVGKPWSKKETL